MSKEDLKHLTVNIQETINENHGGDLLPDGDYGPQTAGAIMEALHGEPGSILPQYCYSWRELKNPHGVCVHYVSAIYSAPDSWDDLATIRQQTIELNLPETHRGPLLPASDKTRRDHASYHYLIGREGHVIQLAPLKRQAFHAGASEWKGQKHCNRWSIGVALVAHAKSGYTDKQYAALNALIGKLKNTYPITEIFGHDECAPGRKHDPGPMFNWDSVR